MRRAFGLWIGLGLILAAASELMFWPVPMREIGPLAGVYGLAGLLAFLMVERAGARGLAAMIVAGGIFGLTIEGVIVQQVYLHLPFSLVWTPLAWHALLSVGVALVGLRMALCAPTMRPGVAVSAAIGLFAALWAGYGWTGFLQEEGRAASTLPFAAQMLVATAMIAAGHNVLDRVPDAPAPRWLLTILAAMALGLWAAAWAGPFFPLSLCVPVLGGVSFLAILRLGGPDGPAGFGRVAPRRYLALLALPAVAIPVDALVRDAPWLSNFNVPVAVVTVVASTLLWCWAMVRAARRRA